MLSRMTIANRICFIEPTAGNDLQQTLDRNHSAEQQEPMVRLEDGIAMIGVEGVMGVSRFADVNTMAVTEQIKAAAADDSIKAILVAVDSPGGQASRVQELSDAVGEAAAVKPVVVQVNQLLASAAMFMASRATAIYAESQNDMAGSIGTRIMLFDVSEAFEKMGIEAVVIDTGQFKSLGAMGTEITEAHRAYLQDLVDGLQEGFNQAVSEGRNLTGKRLDAVTDGRVFRAVEAVELGLIDGIQPVSQTLADLRALQLTGEKTMSQENQPATFNQLKEINNDAEFIFGCQEKGLTVDEAKAAYVDHLKSELEAAKKANGEASQKMKDAVEAERKKVEAENTARAAADLELADGKMKNGKKKTDDADAIQYWKNLVNEIADTDGVDKREATRRAAAREPEARLNYVEAYNKKHGSYSEARKACYEKTADIAD